MKTSTFNRIFENARSVNIQSNEWFNYAGFFWTPKSSWQKCGCCLKHRAARRPLRTAKNGTS